MIHAIMPPPLPAYGIKMVSTAHCSKEPPPLDGRFIAYYDGNSPTVSTPYGVFA